MLFCYLFLDEPYTMKKKSKLNFQLKLGCQLRSNASEGAPLVGPEFPAMSMIKAKVAVRGAKVPQTVVDTDGKEWLRVRKITLPQAKSEQRHDGWLQRSNCQTVWINRQLGLLGVFARIGKGGKWDLWASYVMLINIA
jgi:hypothetical protein